MKFEKEVELENFAEPLLKNLFKKLAWQVPLHSRMVDAVGIDREGKIFGIEFKLRAWKKAVLQAQRHANSMDYVMVCVPNGRFVPDLAEYARDRGVGVLIVDDESEGLRVEVPACQNVNTWLPNREWLEGYLNRNEQQ